MRAQLVRTEFRAVGTACSAAVTAGHRDGGRARRALAAAVAEVPACERTLSRFDPGSDLSRLNGAGGAWTPVDRRLVESLGIAVRAREDTDGRFDPTILREYDIRGVVGRTLDAADAEAIGRAFGTMVAGKGGKTVSVGYDGRLSSPELEAATVKGLLACGLSVLRIGLGPTPMMYFAVNTLPADGGIMISGSHNPPEYNGVKMMMGKGPF